MRKLLVLRKFHSHYYENLYIGSCDLAEQLSTNKGSRFHLTKIPKLRSEVTGRQIENTLRVQKLLVSPINITPVTINI
jgi:hypothetical protein